MESNYQDWRRCNIGQKRLRLLFFTFIITLIMTFCLLIIVDSRLNPLLANYVDLEADKILTYIVNRSVQSLNYDASTFVIIKRNNKNEIERLSYNTGEINRFKNLLISTIEEKINEIENGFYQDSFFVSHQNERKKYSHIRHGYLCAINYNSLRNSVLFGNVGPSIPVKLSFLGYLNVDIDVKLREYGINNVLMEIDVIVDVSSIVTMPVSSKRHHSTIREPISLEMINGSLPDYYLGHSS